MALIEMQNKQNFHVSDYGVITAWCNIFANIS